MKKIFVLLTSFVILFASCTKEESSIVDMDAYNVNAAWVGGSQCNLTITESHQQGTNVSTVTFSGTADIVCSVNDAHKVRYAFGDQVVTFHPDVAYRAWAVGTECIYENDEWTVCEGSKVTKDGGCIKIIFGYHSSYNKIVEFKWYKVSKTEMVEDWKDGGLNELNF